MANYPSIAEWDRSNLDKSLYGVMDAIASHPVFSKTIGVKGGTRTQARNRAVGGAKKSQHLERKALDLDVSRLSNKQKADFIDFVGAYGIRGVGIYKSGKTLHIDTRKNFTTWADDFNTRPVAKQPAWAQAALTRLQDAGPFKAFPAAPAAQPGETGLGLTPSGASLADVYQRAAYQRAMPQKSVPTPTSRPLDSIGGLGAAYRTAAQGRVAPTSPAALAGERFGQSASPASPDQDIAQQAMQRAYAGQTLADMRAGMNMPVDPRTAPRPTASFPARPAGPVNALARAMPTQAQQATPEQQRRAHFVNAVSRTLAPQVQSPTALRQAATGLTTPSPLRQAATGLTVATPGPTPKQDRLPASVAVPATAPVPTARPATSVALNPDRVKDDVITRTPAPAVTASFPGRVAPIAPNAPALAAAVAATPAAKAQTIQRAAQPVRPAQPAQTVQTRQIAQNPQQAQQVAPTLDRWAGMQAPKALDRTVTGAVANPAHPPGIGGWLGDKLQRYGPQIAGTLIAGPIGGVIGGLLGRAFDNAQPGQLLGNPFQGKPGQMLGNPLQGLGGSLKALGMFQSGTPYAGPITNYGTGLRSISDVLGGNAPVGSRAYSRSTPGYSVTSLPNGMVQKTNQYGFTSFERPSMGPTQASFSSFSGPGGMFSGGFGGMFGGGGGQSSGKTSGGRTSGSSGKASGGRKSDRAEAAGYR